MTVGYSGARQKTEAVTRVLRGTALLIGATADEPVRLETGGEVLPGLGLEEEAEALLGRARELEQGLFTIIVLGEFKSGKSTLLNAMLGSKTLPAKATPATAIITVLVGGESDSVAVYETVAPQPRVLGWEEFVREFQLSLEDVETLEEGGTLDRFRNIRYAEMESRHPLCASGVRLVDSPGLGEHMSRTRVSTNFLRQAQAVIFVLNATRILTQSERDFIVNALGEGRLSHVFFVVNRMDQIDPASAEDIRAYVEAALAPHFTDGQGAVDQDLYRCRVHFVSAKQALESRMQIPPDEHLLAASGVPALEAELERFLASEDKVAAALQSALQTVRPIVQQAERRIVQQKAALDQPVAELERRRQESQRRLDALAGRKDEIERTVLLFGEVIRQKVFADLRDYIDAMQATWPQDSRQLIDLDGAISLKSVITSYAQREAKDRMAAAIGEQVQRYVQIKFGQWLDRVPATVQRDIDTMVAEVEAQMGDFRLELEEIATAFAGTTNTDQSGQYLQGAGVMDLALTLNEIQTMTDSVMYPSDWTEVVGQMAQQAVAVFLVGTFLTGGNFLLALVAVQAVNLGLQDHEIKKRIRAGVGDRLHDGLRRQMEEKRAFIYASVEERFREFARVMTTSLQRQLEEVRAEQERVLRQKRDDTFSVEREKARLDAIAERLRALEGELEHGVTDPRP